MHKSIRTPATLGQVSKSKGKASENNTTDMPHYYTDKLPKNCTQAILNKNIQPDNMYCRFKRKNNTRTVYVQAKSDTQLGTIQMQHLQQRSLQKINQLQSKPLSVHSI
jgi:hypothetical protein